MIQEARTHKGPFHMFFGLLWSFADDHCSKWDTILKGMTAGGAIKGKKGKQHHVEGHLSNGVECRS